MAAAPPLSSPTCPSDRMACVVLHSCRRTTAPARLVTAAHWREPASYVGRWTQMLFPNVSVLPSAGVEDPFVWVDGRSAFHAVFHSQIENDDQRLCGGHAFSEDGERWTFGGTAWSNRVPLLDGGGGDPRLYRFSRRERPHLVFDAEGTIVSLTTGVQFGPHSPTSVPGEDGCYTLIQPVRRATGAWHPRQRSPFNQTWN